MVQARARAPLLHVDVDVEALGVAELKALPAARGVSRRAVALCHEKDELRALARRALSKTA